MFATLPYHERFSTAILRRPRDSPQRGDLRGRRRRDDRRITGDRLADRGGGRHDSAAGSSSAPIKPSCGPTSGSHPSSRRSPASVTQWSPRHRGSARCSPVPRVPRPRECWSVTISGSIFPSSTTRSVSSGRERLANATVDTLAMARKLVRDTVPNCKLGTLAFTLHLTHQPSHRALADVLATGDLLHAAPRAGRLLRDPRPRRAARAAETRRSPARDEAAPHATAPPSLRRVLVHRRRRQVLYVGRAVDLRSTGPFTFLERRGFERRAHAAPAARRAPPGLSLSAHFGGARRHAHRAVVSSLQPGGTSTPEPAAARSDRLASSHPQGAASCADASRETLISESSTAAARPSSITLLASSAPSARSGTAADDGQCGCGVQHRDVAVRRRRPRPRLVGWPSALKAASPPRRSSMEASGSPSAARVEPPGRAS